MIAEIWFKTNEKAVRLPVVPSEFERVVPANYETNTVIGLGEVASFNGNGLAQLSMSSFFPNREDSFNAYSNVEAPYDMFSYFKDWKNKGYKVCVFISGTGNLVDLTKELLIHNKELAARKDQTQQDETIASPDGRGNFASAPHYPKGNLSSEGCINTNAMLQCCTQDCNLRI
jgi:hypothetical protein